LIFWYENKPSGNPAFRKTVYILLSNQQEKFTILTMAPSVATAAKLSSGGPIKGPAKTITSVKEVSSNVVKW
jgi:hypothetical protein